MKLVSVKNELKWIREVIVSPYLWAQSRRSFSSWSSAFCAYILIPLGIWSIALGNIALGIMTLVASQAFMTVTYAMREIDVLVAENRRLREQLTLTNIAKRLW